jgi:hypothetical protein
MTFKYTHILPNDIKSHIQKYLYFSKPVANHIIIINNIIKNYNKYLRNEINIFFKFRIYHLYDKLYNIIYNLNYKTKFNVEIHTNYEDFKYKIYDLEKINNIDKLSEYLYYLFNSTTIKGQQYLYKQIIFSNS